MEIVIKSNADAAATLTACTKDGKFMCQQDADLKVIG
jgi:hypothetical protein